MEMSLVFQVLGHKPKYITNCVNPVNNMNVCIKLYDNLSSHSAREAKNSQVYKH